MKNYHFRLATISRIRALEERVARDRYMVALRGRREVQDRLRAAQQALLTFEAPRGVVSIDDVRWSTDQAERMSRTVLVNYEAWLSATGKCEEQRQAWSEASKRSGVLERLDESGRAAWREESMRQETLELDDLTNSRFIASGSRR